MSDSVRELYEMIVECNGAEISREYWEVAEELVKKELITLGSARGPDGNWRRAEPMTEAKPYDATTPDVCWLCGGVGAETTITVQCEIPDGPACEAKDVKVHYSCYMDMEP